MSNSAQIIHLNQLLEEVSVGNYLNFQTYLTLNNITKLDLRAKAQGLTLAYLAASLIDTPVTKLDLSLNKIGAQGAADFAAKLKGTNVTHVNLSNNQIGDQGAADFAANLRGTKVTCVVLNCNQIGNKGAADFAINLIDTNVEEVYLSHNKIGDQGAIAFIDNLKNTLVKHVSFNNDIFIGDDNKISEQTLARLKDALTVQAYALPYLALTLNQHLRFTEDHKNKLISKASPFANDPKEPEHRACNIIRALPPVLAAYTLTFLPGGDSFNELNETSQKTLSTFFYGNDTHTAQPSVKRHILSK